jgi:hypothetical protein
MRLPCTCARARARARACARACAAPAPMPTAAAKHLVGTHASSRGGKEVTLAGLLRKTASRSPYLRRSR